MDSIKPFDLPLSQVAQPQDYAHNKDLTLLSQLIDPNHILKEVKINLGDLSLLTLDVKVYQTK